MSEPVQHCPNPACPYRARHGKPAEYKPGVELCADCGAGLEAGKGCFDADDLCAAEPLDVLCGRPLQDEEALGPAEGKTLRLVRAPGAVSIPVVQLLVGLALLGGGFWVVHGRNFWGSGLLVAGFVFFFLAVNSLKHRDRRERLIQPHRSGFTYRIGRQGVSVALADIELASLEQRPVRIRGVTVGVYHDLVLSCAEKVYTLSSFEPNSLGPVETDPYVLWARSVVSTVQGPGPGGGAS